jgi:hypothetical protein
MSSDAYNPLDKLNLARSIEVELLKREPAPLDALDAITGAGVYALYYEGDFPAYAPLEGRPIYVGKAIPKGGRKGGLTKDASKGKALAERLRHHAASIDSAVNLELGHFRVRYLVVDDIWIPLGENMLIESFKPVWNQAIDGFGNNDPGRRRATQYKSPWDVLHPGRKFAEKLADSGLTMAFLTQRLNDYFSGRPLAKLPRVVAEEQEAENLAAEEGADEAAL